MNLLKSTKLAATTAKASLICGAALMIFPWIIPSFTRSIYMHFVSPGYTGGASSVTLEGYTLGSFVVFSEFGILFIILGGLLYLVSYIIAQKYKTQRP